MIHREVSILGAVAMAAALLFCAAMRAPAQEGRLSDGHSQWHEQFYKKLMRPDTKTSCCNLTDCRPTSGRVIEGRYQVKVNGMWVSVPYSKIIPTSAPDGGYHVCAPLNFSGEPESLYCVILAPEG